MDNNDEAIDDKYNFQETIDKANLGNKDSDDKRSADTIKREDFLSIVKDSNGSGIKLDDSNEPNIDRDGVKFNRDFELHTSKQPDSKPLISEISSSEASEIASA